MLSDDVISRPGVAFFCASNLALLKEIAMSALSQQPTSNIPREHFVVFLRKTRRGPVRAISYATREAAQLGLEVAQVEFPESWMAQVFDE